MLESSSLRSLYFKVNVRKKYTHTHNLSVIYAIKGKTRMYRQHVDQSIILSMDALFNLVSSGLIACSRSLVISFSYNLIRELWNIIVQFNKTHVRCFKGRAACMYRYRYIYVQVQS